MPRIKLSGISTPFVGLSWTVEKSERDIARDLITFIEDRRVLRQRVGHAGALIASPAHERAVASVRAIRNRLREDLARVKRDSPVGVAMRTMQQACRAFLTAAELQPAGETYEAELDALRNTFADQTLGLAAVLGYVLQSDTDWGDEQAYRQAYREHYFLDPSVSLLPSEEAAEAGL